MKKLLVIALLSASLVGIAEARRRCGSNSCAPKCEVKCEQRGYCIGAPCIVDTVCSSCEGPRPSLCALTPARVDLVKHVDTQTHYTCAPLKECQVKPEQWQVDQLISEGHLAEGTRACP